MTRAEKRVVERNLKMMQSRMVAMMKPGCHVWFSVRMLIPRKRKMMQSLRRQKMALDLSQCYLDLAIVLVAWLTVT